jgi:hypothetical protein
MAGLAGAMRNCALPLPAQLGPRQAMALTGGVVAAWVAVRALFHPLLAADGH